MCGCVYLLVLDDADETLRRRIHYLSADACSGPASKLKYVSCRAEDVRLLLRSFVAVVGTHCTRQKLT